MCEWDRLDKLYVRSCAQVKSVSERLRMRDGECMRAVKCVLAPQWRGIHHRHASIDVNVRVCEQRSH